MDELASSQGNLEPRRGAPVGRRPDASSVLSALLGLPAFLSSLTVMVLIGTLLLPKAPWVVPVLWILSGAILFVPAVESVVSRASFDVHRPTQAELRLLAPLWRAVCRVAGVDESRYLLMIEESDQPNAFAAGGRTVLVTRPVLRLPPVELEAILAHELGHHLSAHAMVSRLAWWYAIPARVVAFVGGFAVRLVLGIGRVFLAFGSGLGAFASLLAALIILTFVAFLNFWLILIPLISPLLAWASRLGEYRADRTAALLGYGPALIQVLLRWQVAEAEHGRDHTARSRLLASHPSHAER